MLDVIIAGGAVMSWWISDRDTKRVWAVDIDVMAVLIVVALVGALVGPRLQRDPVGGINAGVWLMIVGAGFVLIAKIALFRQRIWASWGPRLMSTPFAGLYKGGYSFIAIGVLVLVLSFKVAGGTR